MEYSDDGSIAGGERLLRRIPRGRFSIDFNNAERVEPNSDCFEYSPDGSPMSVVLESALTNPVAALDGHEGFALVALTAEQVRNAGLHVCLDTDPDAPPGHAFVFTKEERVRLNGRERKALKKAAEWVVEPPADEVASKKAAQR